MAVSAFLGALFLPLTLPEWCLVYTRPRPMDLFPEAYVCAVPCQAQWFLWT